MVCGWRTIFINREEAGGEYLPHLCAGRPNKGLTIVKAGEFSQHGGIIKALALEN